jgi:HlyD family secretion protein
MPETEERGLTMKLYRHCPAYLAVLALFLSLSIFTSCANKPGNEQKVEVSGIIEAIKTEIRAQAQGEAEKIYVREGQKISQGDLLCVLNSDKLRLQLDQAKAGLEGAEARLRLARKGTKKELIAVAKNQMDAAAKTLELAQKDEERLARLLKEGAVSLSQKEKTDLALEAAQTQYDSARENYQMALRGLEKEEIQVIEAEIERLKSQQQLLKRTILDTEIHSPVSGVLTIKHIELGELAVPGAVLFTLIDPGQTYVKAYVPEKYVGRVKIGSGVSVVCDSYPGKTFMGRTDFIADEAEFAPKNIQTKDERVKLVFMIKAYLDNSGGELKPGMPVDVTIALK